MTFTIRQYQPADLQDLMSAWESANALAHPFLSRVVVDKVRHDIPNLYLPNADTWVAEHNKKVIGFIALIGNEVGAIFVDTPFHGLGAGKALMDKSHSLHPILEVEVFKDNLIGRKFYNDYGFVLIKENIHEPSGRQVLRLLFTKKPLQKS
jgi:putative acetyltransferase